MVTHSPCEIRNPRSQAEIFDRPTRYRKMPIISPRFINRGLTNYLHEPISYIYSLEK